MKIRVPKERAYYASSANEPEKLLCWLPPEDLAELVRQGRVQQDILEYYPDGLEVRVSKQGLEEFGLDLGIHPEALQKAYLRWWKQRGRPKSGMVKATVLEQMAQSVSKDKALFKSAFVPALPEAATEPEMTDGDDAHSVMQRLSR